MINNAKSAVRLDRGRTKALYEAQKPAYEKALQGLFRRTRTLLENHGHTPTIKYRVKRFENYFEKLVRLNRQAGGEAPEINDLLGLRIVCPFLEDIDAIEQLLECHFDVIEVERKGGQHSFREFGYDSVHLLVRLSPDAIKASLPCINNVCEIQLRTILQDAWAEVEHELVYKSPLSLPHESFKRKLAALNATLSLSDLIFQEIRDVQKEIVRHDHKRRTSFTDVGLEDLICAVAPRQPEPGVLEPRPELSLTGAAGSRLEKNMLAALQSHSNGDLETAIRLYSKVLEMKLDQPVRSLVYNHRGMARFGLDEYRLAVRDFTQALNYDSGNVRALTNRGLTLRVLGRFAASLQDYDHALELDPNRLENYWGRAQTCYEMGLQSRALADCRKAVAIDESFSPARELIKRICLTMF